MTDTLNNINWFDTFKSITGSGLLSMDIPPSLKFRIKVFDSERAISEVFIHVISQ